MDPTQVAPDDDQIKKALAMYQALQGSQPKPVDVDAMLPKPQMAAPPNPDVIRGALDQATRAGLVHNIANQYIPGTYGVMRGMQPQQLNQGNGPLLQQAAMAPAQAEMAKYEMGKEQAGVQNKYAEERAKLGVQSQLGENRVDAATLKGLLSGIFSVQGKQIDAAAKPKVIAAPMGSTPISNQTGAQLGPSSTGGATAIDPGIYDREAERYNSTGEIHTPKGLRGPLAMKFVSEVMNRAQAKVDAQTGSGGPAPKPLALATADNKANAGSLASAQKMSDAIDAFESTAGKNLDNFIATAKGVVETGSPLVNKPARWLAANAGDPGVTAYNTARQVAANEIAKVLSNPGMSGVLTDSARHEVNGLMGPDATLKQVYAAANILKQDMANRKAAMADQLGTIRGRISGQPSGPTWVRNQVNTKTGAKRGVYSDGSYGDAR